MNDEPVDLKTAFANYMQALELLRAQEEIVERSKDQVAQKCLRMPYCKNKLVEYNNDLYVVSATGITIQFDKVER